MLYAEPEDISKASSITQHGITWVFDREYPVGQFVNGDWWVVGPVEIVDITPRPGPAPEGESIADQIRLNQWGDTSLRDNNDWRHGSMVVMTPGSAQGYDSRNSNFRREGALEVPYSLEAHRSLISSISHSDELPNQVMHHALMWESEKQSPRVMKTAAVLTCLSEPPPEDAFRPTYVGSEKRIFRAGDLQWDRLHSLDPDPSAVSVPDWEEFERYFERPWIDHLNGSWLGQLLLPTENMPSYGRENARIVGAASLMLHLDVPREQKHDLLIRMVQLGIDLRGIAEVGGNWNEGGGHTSGRKWPILFAGLMLDDAYFFEMPETAIFHEDTQTYWGDGWAGQEALWQMVTHHGCREPYMHLDPDQWPEHDFDGSLGARSGASVSESYRLCCTNVAWPGQALAALLMEAKSIWDHDAFFGNVEDWMREEDIYADGRGDRSRPSQEGGLFDMPADQFVEQMWRQFRASVPEQPGGATFRMWHACESKWVSNPRP